MIHSTDNSFKLKPEEWKELADGVNQVYPDFTARLLELAKISETELQVCLLLKVGTPLVGIANMLNKTRAAITMLRKRLYKKITNKQGVGEQLDEFISNF